MDPEDIAPPAAQAPLLAGAGPVPLVIDVIVNNTNPNLATTDMSDDEELSIAVNPADPDQIVIHSGFGGWNAAGTSNAYVYESTDGGFTWTQRSIIPSPANAGGINGCPCDTTIDYGRNDLLSGAFLTSTPPDVTDVYSGTAGTNPTATNNVTYATAMNGNALRTNQQAVGGVDQPWLLVNPDPTTNTQDNVYVGYDAFGNGGQQGVPMRVAVALGTNPPNFSSRDNSPGDSTGGFVNPGLRLATDPRTGFVWALWQNRVGAGDDNTHRIQYMLNRSTDGGQTWTLNGMVGGIAVATADSTQACPGPAGCEPGGCGGACTTNPLKFGTVNALLGGVLHAAVDPNTGDLFYVYGNRDPNTNNNRLAIRRITTGTGCDGLTVGPESFVTGQVQAALPAVAVTSDGTVGVFYYTFDGFSSNSFPMFSAHLALSSDHGVIFTDQVLKPFLSAITIDDNSNKACRQRALGDFMQLKARGTTFYGAFTANGAAFGRQMANHDPIFFRVTPTTTLPPFCGNGTCDAGENCTSCPQDCGACPPATEIPTSWVASAVTTSCAGPTDGSGNFWTASNFDEVGSGWSNVTLPDSPNFTAASDRFYRGHFTLTATPSDLSVFFRCDDGCEAWINGTYLGGFGNSTCHGLGCVNFPGCGTPGYNQCVPPVALPAAQLLTGDNILAFHVSNGAGGFRLVATMFTGDSGTCGNCVVDGAEQCDSTAFAQGFCTTSPGETSDQCGTPATPTACMCAVTTTTTTTIPTTSSTTTTLPSSVPARAYITNQGSGTLSVIDTGTDNIIATAAVAADPYGVAIAPDGTKVYVTHRYDGLLSVLDAATLGVTATVPLNTNVGGVAVHPDGSKVYVCNGGAGEDSRVSVIDTLTNTVLTHIPAGAGNPLYGLAVSPDGRHAYATSWYQAPLTVIDLDTNSVEAVVPVGRTPWGVAVTPDGARVYVANSYNETTVAVVDTATNTVTTTIDIGQGSPQGVAINPEGTRAYVSSYFGGTVVIDLATNTVIATIAGGGYGLAVSPDGAKVYVTVANGSSVRVVDATTNTLSGLVAVGSGPEAFGLFIGPVPPGQ